MKKSKMIIFSMLMIVLLIAPAVVSTKMTNVEFWLDGYPSPILRLAGIYDGGPATISTPSYSFRILEDHTFTGSYTTRNGGKCSVTGYFTIDEGRISGRWIIKDETNSWTGRLEGHIGI